MKYGFPVRNNPLLYRGGQFEISFSGDALLGLNIFLVPHLGCETGQLRPAQTAVGLQHIPHLLPGRIHILFLFVLNDVRAEIRRRSPARVKVQLMHPVFPVIRGRAIPFGQQP